LLSEEKELTTSSSTTWKNRLSARLPYGSSASEKVADCSLTDNVFVEPEKVASHPDAHTKAIQELNKAMYQSPEVFTTIFAATGRDFGLCKEII